MAIIAGIVFVIIGLVALVFLLSFASESIADIQDDFGLDEDEINPRKYSLNGLIFKTLSPISGIKL